ncbi:MAG TPA: ATP-binding protein [Vicinamibacterales bacterium]|jgi:serine/threonine-protein kinase RsbW|nr:ATP-binding protein [Vicinamibacterales bacterium]
MSGAFQGVHLELQSTIDVLDHLQHVAEDVSRRAGLDEEAVHWTSMAVRECVINAITHGNKSDPAKKVFVDFSVEGRDGDRCLEVVIRDQGQGFEPSEITNPLAPENILNTSGRGIFLVRQFMDEVKFQPAPGGGTEVRMRKRL